MDRRPSGRLGVSIVALAMTALLIPRGAYAEAARDPFSAGGYFRIMTRPDFQGGDSKLGYWNLYGRLLNEGPWGMLNLSLDLLQGVPGKATPTATVFAQIEGGSFANTDAGRGNLGKYANTQLYVRASNVLLPNVTWRIGTLWYEPGDLHIYDHRPGLFFETVGLSATYNVEKLELLLGFGDSGYGIRASQYSTIPTAGAWARFKPVPGRLEVGLGGHYRYEPEVPGNRNAPYATAGVRYEDYVRREVVKSWLEEHPGQELEFPIPEARSSQSYRGIGYLGFGGLGPLGWNSLYASFVRLHPETYYTESWQGRDYQIFVHDLTDERYQLSLANQAQFTIVEEKLDAIVGLMYGWEFNRDNEIAPGDDNRSFYSGVLRLQYYLTPVVHLLGESSLARERSLNGNAFRTHVDSMFANTAGIPDSRGLEFGDSDVRDTWQLKGGVVLNPKGPGVFTRPSLRVLGGLQHSTQQAAYGNGFNESLDQYNTFAGTESHWHAVLAIEAEAWF